MGQWHRENPELATEIAALPPSQQNAAERAGLAHLFESTEHHDPQLDLQGIEERLLDLESEKEILEDERCRLQEEL